jgi:Cytochrome c554 and c-prime
MRMITPLLVGSLLLAGPAWSQPDPDSAPFTSAIVCGECHKDIHAAWKQNRHSTAATNPVFLRSLEKAEERGDEETRRLCLTCHAPTTVRTDDLDMKRAISRESVTCDFCHSLTASKPGEKVPFELEVGLPTNIKRGPYKDADAKAHGVAYSELHLVALFCAGCHEYETASGVRVLSTYSEYKEGPYYRRNIPCQGCHMPVVMADVVDPKVKRDPEGFINLHRMPGGHAEEQLRRSAELRWGTINRVSGELRVQVEVSNVGAGHRLPTGLPTRRVVLEVEVRAASGKTYREQAVYRKIVVDAGGKEILEDGEMFTRAAAIRQDNRIKPGERRVQNFSFLLPPSGGSLELSARLIYESSPLGPSRETRRVPFARIEKTIS